MGCQQTHWEDTLCLSVLLLAIVYGRNKRKQNKQNHLNQEVLFCTSPCSVLRCPLLTKLTFVQLAQGRCSQDPTPVLQGRAKKGELRAESQCVDNYHNFPLHTEHGSRSRPSHVPSIYFFSLICMLLCPLQIAPATLSVI